jgi:hypothetical protein
MVARTWTERNIYIISNESIPNHYKVGQTKRDAEQRAKEMNTYAPTPYEVEHVVRMNSDASVHRMLQRHGYVSANDNEWYQVDLTTLKSLVEMARLEELDQLAGDTLSMPANEELYCSDITG